MKHYGNARRAGFKLILIALILVILVLVLGIFGALLASLIVAVWPVFVGIWVLFGLFTLYFFRDPTPRVPAGANLVVAPAHGKVDVVDTAYEPKFMGGDCLRVSIFLSVFDVHVQNAPVGGKLVYSHYSEGQFLNALRVDSAIHNENLLFGFEAAEPAGQKVGVRLIAGLIARRIVPYVTPGEDVARGDRISLIQFGSRADVYFPKTARIQVKVGDKVKGGETVLAQF